MSAAPRRIPFALVPLLVLGLAASARADDGGGDDQATLKIDYSGQIQTDLRFRTNTVAIGSFYDRLFLPAGVERNQNLIRLKLKASYGAFTGVADADFVINGFSGKLQGLSDLSQVEKVQPYRFDVNSLYVEAKNLLPGLDLRVGQQIVLWGVGDQFNPTNNLNPDDLRDPLLFGKQAGNFMVKADYFINDEWSITGVLVPVFKPALLPNSAALGVAAADRLPFTDSFIRHRIEAESGFAEASGTPTVVSSAVPVLPETTLDNMQFAYRIAGTIKEQDVSLSYYNGRTDFPQPFFNHTHMGPLDPSAYRCDPAQPTKCVTGLLQQDVELQFPKMHVYGLNVTGEIPMSWISKALHGLGYRVEGALIVPSEATLRVYNDTLNLGGITKPAGEYDYPNGKIPTVIEDTPFLKWVVGLDYAFGSHVYANAQWVHGLLDEYGAGDFLHAGYVVRASGVSTTGDQTLNQCVLPSDGTRCAKETLRPRLGDYLSLGVDLKFKNDAALLRIFTILDLTPTIDDEWDPKQMKRVQTTYKPFSANGGSAVIYPDFNYNLGSGLELGAGALIQLGKSWTKFGDPAAGGSLVFGRARFSY